jgi:hypothetical protein
MAVDICDRLNAAMKDYDGSWLKSGHVANATVEDVALARDEIRRLREAIAAEREACAKIADAAAIENKIGVKNAAADIFVTRMLINECAGIAAAIRARSNFSK